MLCSTWMSVMFEQGGKEIREEKRERVEASTIITRTNQNNVYKKTSKRQETHLNPLDQLFDGKNMRDGLPV
jgi:hypothetical protein